MANVSNWKGWEWEVAKALGGKRRFRTMESFGKEAPDVYFPRKFRHKYPLCRTVAVECKKRRALSIPALFAEAVSKYGEAGSKNIILATRMTRKGTLKKELAKLRKAIEKRYAVGGKIYKKRLKKAEKEKGHKLGRRGLRKFNNRILKLQMGVFREYEAKLRARHSILGLVTVDLAFFKKLWEVWIGLDDKGDRVQIR